MKTVKNNSNKGQKFAFPPKKEMERVIKYFSDPNCKEINQGLVPNASELEKAKYEICQSISRYKRINNLTPAKLAHKIGISQAKIDDILFGRISELNLSKLITYTEKLNGHLQVKVDYGNEKTPATAH
jgi:predicted XRE-type DNA-binding protein